MIRIAPIALLILALAVPICNASVLGHAFLLLIVSGIFFGTVSLGNAKAAEELPALSDNQS